MKTLHLIDGNGVITEVITLPHSENLSSLRMIWSYNGLTCFTNYPWYIHPRRIQASEGDLKIYICNPATHETRALPIGSPSEAELGMGVALGPGASEYKVFRFFSSNFDDDGELNPECEIFSSSTGAWRGIGRLKQSPLGAHHIFCNGKVYWFMAGEEDRETVEDILSVDMEGNFKTIELPDDTTDWSFLIDLDGCLSFIVVNYDDRLYMKVWILKDENESVWELKCWDYTPFADDNELLNSVAARKNEIVFMTTIHCYILNTDKTIWKRIYFAEFIEQDFFIVFPYKKSLLPCKYSNCFQFICFWNSYSLIFVSLLL